VATAVLALLAGGLVAAAPARAEPFPFTDGFESPSLWVQDEVSGLTDVTIQRDGRARNGTNNIAILHAFPRSPALATVFRVVNPDDITPRPGRSCTPSVYLRRVDNPGETMNGVDVLLRVRRGGPTGQIISTRGVLPRSTDAWVFATFNPFPWPTEMFTIEISAFLGTVLVDDLSFSCP
jgi:hypothetical protein